MHVPKWQNCTWSQIGNYSNVQSFCMMNSFILQIFIMRSVSQEEVNIILILFFLNPSYKKKKTPKQTKQRRSVSMNVLITHILNGVRQVILFFKWRFCIWINLCNVVNGKEYFLKVMAKVGCSALYTLARCHWKSNYINFEYNFKISKNGHFCHFWITSQFLKMQNWKLVFFYCSALFNFMMVTFKLLAYSVQLHGRIVTPFSD